MSILGDYLASDLGDYLGSCLLDHLMVGSYISFNSKLIFQLLSVSPSF